jgi:hypothetical protein
VDQQHSNTAGRNGCHYVLVPEDFICFRSETNFAMAMSEIDSFIWKFKKLLHSGNNAHLEIRSEAGKATVNLNAEAEISFKPQFQSRNGPSAHQRHPFISRWKFVTQQYIINFSH